MLGNAPTSTRFFANWSMQLAQPDTSANTTYTDSMYVAPAVVELLYRTPQAAPSILAMLAPLRAADSSIPDQHDRDRAVLTEVVRRVVVPQLAAAHGLLQPVDHNEPAFSPEFTQLSQLSQLPRLLLAAEPSRAFKLIADAYADRQSLGELCASLLEPTARSLGDLWQSDECSELDVTLGLCRMQTAIRRLDLSSAAPAISVANAHTALLATQPGEPHMLDVTTNAEMLWQAGWNTRVEFPATDEALQMLVADTWFDSLDLSMSPSFCREDWVERLKATIAAARRASKNPSIAIVISGRLAFDHADSAARVGADSGSRTALQIESVMLEALRHGGGDD
jgi:MerR family transcriptional regulator, light-induced transcriptional regulator